VAIEQLYLILQVGTNMGGRVHITEVRASLVGNEIQNLK
jgi:hypothetical protein